MRLLDAVLRRGVPLEAAFVSATRDLDRADDRAFAHAIAAESLRRLTDIDALIDSATAKRLPDDAKARFALRLALVQALALGTPPHAAISTILPLLDGGPRRLVHGVFGRLLREGATLPNPPRLPPAVAARWQKAWGEAAVEAASRAIAAPPPLDLSFPTDRPPPLEGHSLLPGHLRLDRGHAVAGLAGYDDGLWWVQDIAAALPARLLGAGSGRTALDLCAAPGGKTMQLAAAGFDVVAVDVSESRLARLATNLQRTGLDARVITADVMTWTPPSPVDAILLDAPCSATGIFRRHPDVLYRVQPKAIMAMAEAQAAMIDHAADWLKPGGTLVYSVCSLEPAEGEEVAADFLARRSDYAVDPVRDEELALGMRARPDGMVRLLPGTIEEQGGADSFFLARFRRR